MLSHQFFRHYFFSRRAGSLVRILAWFSILGIAIGVASLIVVISVMTGMHANIHQRITGIEPHIMWSLKDLKEADDLLQSLAYTEIDKSQLVSSSFFERQDLIIRSMEGVFRGVQARGWDPESWRKVTENLKSKQENGKNQFLNWLDSPLPGPGEIFIGYDLARMLGVIEGDPVHLITPEGILLPMGEVPEIETVTVKKIIMTSLQDIDEGHIYYRRNASLLRFKDSASREFGMELWLKDPFRTLEMESSLQMAGAKVSTWKDQNSSLFFALTVEKSAIGLFLSLSALIASLSIVIVLTLLISQKKSDIAILMAMGLSRARMQRTFASVGMQLSGLGVVSGVTVGLTIAFLLQEFPINLLPTDIYYDSQIPCEVDFQFVFLVFAASIFVSVISSWLPVRALAFFQPVEILRR